jgi:hypothetical protein
MVAVESAAVPEWIFSWKGAFCYVCVPFLRPNSTGAVAAVDSKKANVSIFP